MKIDTKTLGGQASILDVRDIQLAQVQAPITIPDEYMIDTSKIEKLFQNGFGTCSAHAGAHFKQIQEYLETGKSEKLSPRYLWIKTKQIDGVPLIDGSFMRAILKTLLSSGISDYSMLPNDYTITLQQYSDLGLITSEMDNNANPRVIETYAFVNDLSLEGLKNAIYQNKAVLMRIVVDEGFFRTTTPTFTQAKWGHLVCACGYDKDNILIIDSTEEEFPIKKIHKQYLRFITEAGTAVDADTELVRKLIQQKALLQKLVELYRQLLKLLGYGR